MTSPTATAWLVPTAGSLLDREMIREAMARYCRGIDRLDADLIKSAYHPDAFDDHGPFKGTRDDFVEWIVPFLRREYVTTSHHLTTMSIEVEGDVAYVETYAVVVQQKEVDGKTLQLVANSRYADRFERRGGDWRIATRVVIMDSSRTDDIAAWQGSSPLSSMTAGARDRSDPAYRR
ncbi:MAG: hypothetical protein JWO57_2251 [Pseudonocardiales bacterium]|nr:hypothetical protein [Pseudonocardiales bacterium]